MVVVAAVVVYEVFCFLFFVLFFFLRWPHAPGERATAFAFLQSDATTWLIAVGTMSKYVSSTSASNTSSLSGTPASVLSSFSCALANWLKCVCVCVLVSVSACRCNICSEVEAVVRILSAEGVCAI